MAKTIDQIYAERRQEIEARRKYLVENPDAYRRDFDEAFKTYLTKEYPEGLDPEDCDNRFHPLFREDFPESPEGLELAIKYSLHRAWDPDGDKPPGGLRGGGPGWWVGLAGLLRALHGVVAFLDRLVAPHLGRPVRPTAPGRHSGQDR